MPEDDAIVATQPLGIWDVATGKKREEFAEFDNNGVPFAVAASRDGQFVALGSLVKQNTSGAVCSTIHIFDLLAGKEVRSVTLKDMVFGMKIDASTQLWLTGTRKIYLWDFSVSEKPTPAQVYNYLSFTDPIRHINTPNWEFGTIYGLDVRVEKLDSGNWGVFACWDRVARLGMSDGGVSYFPELPHDGPVYDAVLNDEGALAATASHDGTARVFDVATRQEIGRVIHGAAVTAVRFLPGTSDVVSVGVDDTVRISSVN
ncbi:WD40 repeat domain-containing protein [Amycolatopsis sp. cmx-8-4]|uniref:WD40 repeat domain-containing protein n=1 Tax=Amycolatopsis sp. cmx-8-4 TaxID=2790947 RepID=UPI00397E59C5